MLPQTCGGHNRRPTIVRFGTAHAVTSVFSGRASIARRRRRKGLTALTCPAQRRDGEDLLERPFRMHPHCRGRETCQAPRSLYRRMLVKSIASLCLRTFGACWIVS